MYLNELMERYHNGSASTDQINETSEVKESDIDQKYKTELRRILGSEQFSRVKKYATWTDGNHGKTMNMGIRARMPERGAMISKKTFVKLMNSKHIKWLHISGITFEDGSKTEEFEDNNQTIDELALNLTPAQRTKNNFLNFHKAGPKARKLARKKTQENQAKRRRGKKGLQQLHKMRQTIRAKELDR